MNTSEFNRNMGLQTFFGAIVILFVAIVFRCYNISFFGIDSSIFSLIFSVMGGISLIIAFDYYNNGVSDRSFGLAPLYVIGIIVGLIIYYLLISNVPLDFLAQVQSFLKIEAVR